MPVLLTTVLLTTVLLTTVLLTTVLPTPIRVMTMQAGALRLRPASGGIVHVGVPVFRAHAS